MPPIRKVVKVVLFVLILQLNVPVVKSLHYKRQTTNAPYDPHRLVNPCGAFGTVGDVREEWIIFASIDKENREEYEFKVKHGKVKAFAAFHFTL